MVSSAIIPGLLVVRQVFSTSPDSYLPGSMDVLGIIVSPTPLYMQMNVA